MNINRGINYKKRMELSKNWLTDNLVDLEYKKYQMFAYLKEVKALYSVGKIYPHLSELIEHHRDLLQFKKSSSQFKSLGKLRAVNWEKMQLEYEFIHDNTEVLLEVARIADFAIPLLQTGISEGAVIYNLVKENLQIQPVGITPINKQEGYLFLSYNKKNEVHIYRYWFSRMYENNLKLKTANLTYYSCMQCTFDNSFENIKSHIIRHNTELPNPAVYSIQCSLEVPLNETLLPVAKRFFEGKIAA